ncbi:MAG: lysophospholipid acyltransferase family protein [Dehalococcoidia bacterium]|uniref:lysophospholipid acyltransferase family protein n=1 Tax=Candidatus Amarobacter glycogenicus TaxID=3140699 RepID=UPI003135A182|nr:lysophospholipid acyltransferase family protein [Dehalococcoidia bacterium]
MGRGFGGTFQYRAWRVVSATLEHMPPRAGYAVAAAAGNIGYYCWPRGRRAMHENFAHVLRGTPRKTRHAVARRSMVNYCKYLADFVRFPGLSPEAMMGAVTGGREFEALDAILERGQGAVIACMHFGNWDLGAGATAARGYPLTVVVETFADPRLDALIAGARERAGMNLVRMEKAGPSLLRALTQNGVLALLIDRPVAEGGVRVTFFGEEVEVPAGPARLALRTGAKVVPTAFVRTSPGKPDVTAICDFDIEAVSTGDRDGDTKALTQAIMQAHERIIRQHPDQWYMFRPMWAKPARAVVR